jgi:hypothetical protein
MGLTLRREPLRLSVRATGSGRRALAIAKPIVEPFEELSRGFSNGRAGRKYGVRARFSKRREVLGGDDAADDDHRMVKTELMERCFQSRDEREVAGGQ